MEFVLSAMVGLGLSAACGFRVFVPLLVLSIAALSGHVHLAPSFSWIGSYPALAAFSLATALEIAGYYIPVVDHFLDTVATPAAIVAGSIITASFLTDVSPFVRWSLAVVAGGGVAAAVQGTTVLTRALSTVGTAGFGNPLVATAELGGSIVTSVLSLILPVLVVFLILAFLIVAGSLLLRRRNQTRRLAV